MGNKINTAIVDDFTVLDLAGTRKSGIPVNEFTVTLYNPVGSEVSGSVTVTISEVADGNYRVSFTPTSLGIWKVVIKHPTYFSQGKENSYLIFNNDIDSVDDDIVNLNGSTFTAIPDMAKETSLIAQSGVIATILVDVTAIKKIETGRWKITNNQMIFYDDNGVTPLYTYDLKDDVGNPTMTNPFERVPE
jgi:hypothetical protein